MEINKKIIEKMDYSNFVALVKERNRPSGGIKTIQRVAVNAFIDSNKKMLEIGCNTGFTSVNMALLTGCECIGIDINKESIKEARKYAKRQGIEKRVKFEVANALSLPFKDNSFDIVFCSNVTSFIDNKERAIKEYLRVLKTGGTLVVIPIYYIKKPPITLINKVSEAIGTNIQYWNKDFWINLFKSVCEKYNYFLELYYEKDFIFLDRKKQINKYIAEIMKKDHLMKLNATVRNVIRNRMSYFMNLFNENLKYAGFSIILYQKRKLKDEIELFITKERVV